RRRTDRSIRRTGRRRSGVEERPSRPRTTALEPGGGRRQKRFPARGKQAAAPIQRAARGRRPARPRGPRGQQAGPGSARHRNRFSQSHRTQAARRMNRIITLAFKDLAVLTREKEALFWIFLFPLIFALFFGFLSGGGGGDRGKLQLAAVDEDQSEGSR